MRLRDWLGMAFALAAPVTALAQDLPRFDVQVHCQRLAGLGGQMSQSVFGICMDVEQAAYDGLKPTWQALPSAVREHCLSLASFGGPGSYAVLQTCIQVGVDAGKQNKQRQFRY
jgi:hypothetical protein